MARYTTRNVQENLGLDLYRAIAIGIQCSPACLFRSSHRKSSRLLHANCFRQAISPLKAA